jgi:lysophospholipase L1-like esterase
MLPFQRSYSIFEEASMKLTLTLGLFAVAFTGTSWAAGNFYLRNGDRVLFYGDSITEQRYYPVAVETYVRTRFPDLKVSFVDSAVGGARVTGNWAVQSETESLARDVFPFKPTVVTIMLGMNDGKYQPLTPAIFDTFRTGYENIVQSLQAHLPGVRIVPIEPSPWDDVTVTSGYSFQPDTWPPPHTPGGYNQTMIRFSQFLKKLGEQHHFLVVDFNTPLVKLMEEAVKTEPALAGKIVPGRIHPGASGELAMAQALLKAWGAPATVTRVAIDAADRRVTQSASTTVSDLASHSGAITWAQTDQCLPYPIMTLHADDWPQFPPDPFGSGPTRIFWHLPPLKGETMNPVALMIVKFMKMYEQLDAEILRVGGLQAPSYSLAIDGESVGRFSREQLAAGVNLAEHETPMMDQADKVLALVWKEEDVRFFGWRAIQVPLWNDTTPGIRDAVDRLLARLGQEQAALAAEASADAQPRTWHYELRPL